jgi:phytoene/squalene synthetase
VEADTTHRKLLPLEEIMRIYSRLLDAIEKCDYDVLRKRVSCRSCAELSKLR